MSNTKNPPEIKAVAFDIDGTMYPNFRFYIKIAFAAKKVFCCHYISRRNGWKTTKKQ